ncbi:MAG: hypothetical protein IJ054_06580 [Lachnospiraceae bacterium]|nr:hypothetical protein [Lachnospiraceae bacterium]MBQ9232470.1 hypothetical protein [Lachnospiraceae bacterium]
MKLIRRFKGSKLYKDNRGSAMIVAIVVSIIVITFTLSLLLVSYSLFVSNERKVTQSQVKELSKSINIEIGDELTSPNFDDSQALLDGINNYENAKYCAPDYNMWYYVRYNLFQNNWPYYRDETTAGHVEANAYRYFKLSLTGGDTSEYSAMADDISVCMYWECEDIDIKDQAILTVEVTVTKGGQTSTTTSYYELGMTYFDDEISEKIENNKTDSAFNPAGNTIDLNERWTWTRVN